LFYSKFNMSYKKYLEIETTDAFTTGSKLKSLKGIMGISIVTCNKLRIKYNNKQIDEQKIITLINQK
jgi:hypothetical protein